MGKGWIIRGFRRGLYGKGRLKTLNPSFQTTLYIAIPKGRLTILNALLL